MFRKSYLATKFLLAALAILAATMPARATVWVGAWDPKFGSPFTIADSWVQNYDLGWSGEVKVDDGPCAVPGGGGDITNAGDCGGGASVVSLSVGLYEVPNVTPVYNTLTFNPASLTIDTLRYDNTGTLIGISTTFESNYVYDDYILSPPNGAGTDAWFAIQFVIDGAPCQFCDSSPFPDLPSTYTGAVLFAGLYPGECEPFCEFYRSNVAEFPALITFSTPEPAGLALLAAALLAVGAARRHHAALKTRQLA